MASPRCSYGILENAQKYVGQTYRSRQRALNRAGGKNISAPEGGDISSDFVLENHKSLGDTGRPLTDKNRITGSVTPHAFVTDCERVCYKSPRDVFAFILDLNPVTYPGCRRLRTATAPFSNSRAA